MALLAIVGVGARGEDPIDVLVVFTESLRSQYYDDDGIEALLIGNFASANEAFEKSGVDLNLRLVAFREVDYVEENWSMAENLDHLASEDGFMDEALRWRDDYGADLVYFYRASTDENIIGSAYLLRETGGDESLGFGVVSARQSLSELVLQHEVGHNLGAAHDRENASTPGLFSDSYGYRFWNKSRENPPVYRTLMAYAPGSAVNQFSTPDRYFDFLPTGVAEGPEAANNVRALNATRGAVSRYRDVPTDLPPVPDAGRDQTIEAAAGEDFVEVSLSGRSWWSATDEVTWTWEWEGGSVSGQEVEVSFPLGRHEVTLRMMDGFGNVGTDTLVVEALSWSEILEVRHFGSRTFIIKESGISYVAGRNGSGSMGTGSRHDSSRFVRVLLDDIARVSSSYELSLFVTRSGALYGAGEVAMTYGDYDSYLTSVAPVQLVGSGVVSAAVGSGFGLYVTEAGELWGWGGNPSGVLSETDPHGWRDPFRLIGSGVQSVEAGPDWAIVEMEDGSWWGAGSVLRFFVAGDRARRSSFARLFGADVTKVAVGDRHLVALYEEGRVVGWGDRLAWGLGRPMGSDRVLSVELVESGAVDLWAFDNLTLFKRADGSIWGLGEWLRRLDGIIEDGQREPTRLFGSRVSDVLGPWLIERNDGSVWAAVSSENFSLGLGDEVAHQEVMQAMPWGPLPSSLGNAAPQIRVTGATTRFDTDGDGWARARLDAGASQDDWAIDRFEWRTGEQVESGPVLDREFPLGTTEVRLRVFDSDQAYSEKTFEIVVKGSDARPVDVEVLSGSVLALRSDGAVWGVGLNDSGVLGKRDELREISEWKVLMESGARKVVTGERHALVLKEDGSLWASGNNELGQLGTGDQENAWGFVEVVSEGVVEVSAEAYTSYFVKDDGSAWGMGYNYKEHLGDVGELIVTTPVALAPGIEATRAFGVFDPSRGTRTHLITADGRLLVSTPEGDALEEIDGFDFDYFQMGNWWGAYSIDSDGRAYRHRFEREAERRYVGKSGTALFSHPLAEVGFAQIELRRGCVLGRTRGGAILGTGTGGARGPGYTLPEGIEDVLFGSGVMDVAIGSRLIAFVHEDGSVWLMGTGDQAYSEYEDGLLSGKPRGFPLEFLEGRMETNDEAPVASAGGDAFSVTIGGEEKVRMTLSAEASYDDRFLTSWEWRWGDEMKTGIAIDAEFPVGVTAVTLTVEDSSGTRSSTEALVEVDDDYAIRKVASGPNWSLLILEDGSVYGSSSQGEAFGTGKGSLQQGARLPLSGIVDASVSETHALLLDEDGGVWFFGYNLDGAAGLGHGSELETPTRVIPADVVGVSAGRGWSLILKRDGSLWGAGANEYGQLGVGDRNRRMAFTRIVESGVVSMSAGERISGFVKEDGSLWQMGMDAFSESWDFESAREWPECLLESGSIDVAAGLTNLYVTREDGAVWATKVVSGEERQSKGDGREGWAEVFSGRAHEVLAPGYVLAVDGSLWRVGRSDYSLPKEAFEEPLPVLFGNVKSVGVANGGVLVLRSDGVVLGNGSTYQFSFGREEASEGQWKHLAGQSSGWIDRPPEARIGSRLNLRGFTPGELSLVSGSLLKDDWHIDAWKWRVDGKLMGGGSILWIRPEAGVSTIELEATDEAGYVSRTRARFLFFDSEAFASWLTEHFGQSAATELEKRGIEDSDGDGFSDIIEFRSGTLPNAADSAPRFRFVYGDSGQFGLKVLGLAPGAQIRLARSVDLDEWESFGGESVADESGELFVPLGEGGAGFFRIE